MSTRSLFLLVICIAAAAGKGNYRAAVVDYQPPKWDETLDESKNLMNTLNDMELFIVNASKSKADIIVFPEGGLLGDNNNIFFKIPSAEEKISPINNNTYATTVQNLAGFAKTYKIYLVVNLHENYTDSATNKTYKYNTNVVFDRNGFVIARYRKFNLFEEPLDITPKPEYSYFDTDFNVRFGQFICFDILFKEPALTLIKKYNITDLIHSSMWFSELPFLTSVQVQWGWSRGNKVNLLASGYNKINRASVGSGIYRGQSSQDPTYVFGDRSGNTLLIDDVPSETSNKTENQGAVRYSNATFKEQLDMLQQPDMDFTSVKISLPLDGKNSTFKEKICHGGLCCSFEAHISNDSSTSTNSPVMHYRAIVFNGTRTFGYLTEKRGIQLCGIVSCSNETLSGCGILELDGSSFANWKVQAANFESIRISGNFETEDHANVLPNVLKLPQGEKADFLLSSSQFSWTRQSNGTAELSISAKNKIITAGISARVFSFSSKPNGATTMNITFYTLFLPLAVFTIFGSK